MQQNGNEDVDLESVAPCAEGLRKQHRQALEEQQKQQQQNNNSNGDEDRNLQHACGKEHCYGRMFNLRPFDMETSELVKIGVSDYMDDIDRFFDPIPMNIRGAAAPAGYTYLGQLVAHDLSMDVTSVLGNTQDPNTVPNFVTPFLDLDTIYGVNGATAPMDGPFFRLEGRDFSRQGNGQPQVADGRNDNHRILSQLTVAFMKLHNKFAQIQLDEHGDDGRAFDAAKRETIQTYQSVVLTDMLPKYIDNGVYDIALNSRNHVLYTGDIKNRAAIPAEFAACAFRVAHSRSRATYRVNGRLSGTFGRPVAALFSVEGFRQIELIGGSPLPSDMEVQWSRFFFDFPIPGFTNSARINDMRYAAPLLHAPFGKAAIQCNENDAKCTGECGEHRCVIVDGETIEGRATLSLALIDLTRGQTMGMPGGIALARHVRESTGTPLQVLSVDQMKSDGFGLPENYNRDDVPLLLYLAHESVIEHQGTVLGFLGSLIVGETIIGLVDRDHDGILHEGNWHFHSRITNSHEVSMRDVLNYIGWVGMF